MYEQDLVDVSQTRKQREIGTPVRNKRSLWVQTDRENHEAWALLALRKPRAAALLHVLVAHMGSRNVVVISQKLLATMLECSTDTVQRAVRDLVAGSWIQVVSINGGGTVCGYVVNNRVAWGEDRDRISKAIFQAQVVVDRQDQSDDALSGADLRKIPQIVERGTRKADLFDGQDERD